MARSKAFRLAEAQNWRCACCRGEMDTTHGQPNCATADHLTPRMVGGAASLENAVAACHSCNTVRGAAFTVWQFYRLRRRLAKNGDWPPGARPTRAVKKMIAQKRVAAESQRAAVRKQTRAARKRLRASVAFYRDVFASKTATDHE